ncbi:hypothetical protein KAU11_12180, partial [Candidatus Babeliales bacterium]|nr:hypothetical protein [Candidatus Babeliales bacterium]
MVMMLAGVAAAGSGTTTITVDCWNNCGSSSCWICGGSYTCGSNANWVSDCSFSDPVPPGHKVTRIEATANGVGCSSPPTQFNVLINSEMVGNGNMPYGCLCNHCSPTTVTSAYYGNGFPGYVYGGSNTLTMDVLDYYMCLNDVTLTIHYEPENQTVPEFASFTVALVILLTTPAFAYLIVKKNN